jgi:hypothetical protein
MPLQEKFISNAGALTWDEISLYSIGNVPLQEFPMLYFNPAAEMESY